MNHNVGPNLRKLMDLTGMSQQYVADKVGVSRPLVSTWIRGKNKLSADQLCSLAKLFKIPMDVLFNARPEEITPEWLEKASRLHDVIKDLGFGESYRRLLLISKAS